MTLTQHIIGCDISKDKIDFFDAKSSKHYVVANTPVDLNRFIAGFVGQEPIFAFEATGYYGNALRKALHRHRMACIQVNPLHARRFAQSTGRLAKTDRIDAAQIATMAKRLELPQSNPFDEDVEHLKSLIIRRDQLVDMRSAEHKRFKQTDCEVVHASIGRQIEVLQKEIDTFDALIEETIMRTETIKARYDLFITIPGIGPATAAVLIAMLPEAGHVNRSKLAALAGVAPMAWDSGTFQGKRSIAGGRPRIRRALYLAALGTLNGRSRFAEHYRKLKSAGKPTKVALIAIARKILTTANAIIKSGQPYAP